MNSSANISPSPLCSVIIPTYKGGNKLQIILASLYRQTFSSERFEVIIVDDGSPEIELTKIENICRDFQNKLTIYVLHLTKNGGPARARNRGIAAAQGEYIFFTDDDCEVPALWMETHLTLYKERPHISSIGGWYKFSRKQLSYNAFAQFWHFHYLSIFSPINMETFVGTSEQSVPNIPAAQNTANLSIRRSVLALVPGFDEDYLAPGREDTYFAQQIYAAGLTSLFIPLHVRHTSPLTFKRFLRVVLNRGLGNYVRLQKVRWIEYRPIQYKYELGTYKYHVNSIAKYYSGVAKNKRLLFFLGRIYYTGMGSPLALSFHGWRWRCIIRKRDGM